MRRQARQCALQLMFQLDMQKMLEAPVPAKELSSALRDYWSSFEEVHPDDRAFAERLVHGVLLQLAELDEAIAQASRKWRLKRMDKVDLNLLRVSAYEILYCPDVPRAAAINEAVEIAKRFCSQDSAAFVNGILDQLGKAPDEVVQAI